MSLLRLIGLIGHVLEAAVHAGTSALRSASWSNTKAVRLARQYGVLGTGS